MQYLIFKTNLHIIVKEDYMRDHVFLQKNRQK